jgi:branched-chain amino acid transport system permease protein
MVSGRGLTTSGSDTVISFHEQLLQYVVTGVTTGAIYALLAVGFVVIYNVTGVINFAQGESAMLGALLMVQFSSRLAWPLPVAFLLTLILVTAIGALLYGLAIRPARGASPASLIIITIGASIALRGAALMIWGTNSYLLPAFTPSPPLRLGSAVLRSQSLWVMGTTLVAVTGLYFFFQRTMAGKAMRACAVNRLAAQLMGISQVQMGALAFGLGAALGAVAGTVIAPITYATYDMGTMLGLKGFVAAIIGGLTNPWGAVAGGLLLGVLEAVGAGVISSGAKDAIAFAVLVAILLFRPSGLMGGRSPAYGGL